MKTCSPDKATLNPLRCAYELLAIDSHFPHAHEYGSLSQLFRLDLDSFGYFFKWLLVISRETHGLNISHSHHPTLIWVLIRKGSPLRFFIFFREGTFFRSVFPNAFRFMVFSPSLLIVFPDTSTTLCWRTSTQQHPSEKSLSIKQSRPHPSPGLQAS